MHLHAYDPQLARTPHPGSRGSSLFERWPVVLALGLAFLASGVGAFQALVAMGVTGLPARTTYLASQLDPILGKEGVLALYFLAGWLLLSRAFSLFWSGREATAAEAPVSAIDAREVSLPGLATAMAASIEAQARIAESSGLHRMPLRCQI